MASGGKVSVGAVVLVGNGVSDGSGSGDGRGNQPLVGAGRGRQLVVPVDRLVDVVLATLTGEDDE